MAELLASGTISGGDLYSNNDKIFDGVAVPQNTNVASAVFDFGKTLNALELVGVASSELVITGATTITVAWDSDSAGSFTDTQVFSVAGGTIPAGTELFRYVADHTKPVFYKVTVATTDAGATEIGRASCRERV